MHGSSSSSTTTQVYAVGSGAVTGWRWQADCVRVGRSIIDQGDHHLNEGSASDGAIVAENNI